MFGDDSKDFHSNPIAFLFQNVVKVVNYQGKSENEQDTASKLPKIEFDGKWPLPADLNTEGMLKDLSKLSQIRLPAHIASQLREFMAISDDAQQYSNDMLVTFGSTSQLFATSMDFQSDEEGEQDHDKVETEQISDETELPIEEKKDLAVLLDNIKSMESVIIRYLHHNFTRNEKEEDFICKICGVSYSTGRQLGGHMSRKHPGSSEAYNRKKIIHRVKTGQRARREYFKNTVERKFRKRQQKNLEEKLQVRSEAKQISQELKLTHEPSEAQLELPIPMEVQRYTDYGRVSHNGHDELIFME